MLQLLVRKEIPMRKFFKKDDGLVTIEWVGIAAVMVLAAIAITAFVMQGADAAGNDVVVGLGNVTNAAATAGPPAGTFGDGTVN